MRLLARTIRGEFALFAISLALPFVLLIGYGLYDRTRDDLAAAEAIARRLAEANADRVSEYVAGLRATLEAVARRPLVRAMDAARCDPRLADLVDLYPRAGSLIVVDREGVILCSSRPLPRDRVVRIADEELLGAMLADPRFRVSKPIVSRVSDTGHWIVSAVQPVFGEGGALVGTVAMATDLAQWHSISPPEGLPAGAIVTVVTADGTVIARSVDANKWISRKLWDERLLKQVLQATEGVLRAKGVEGVDRIFGVSAVAGLPWFVLVGLPEESVFAPGRERLMQTGAFLALVVIILLLLAWGFVARLTKPIRAIAAAVGARAEGGAETKIPVAGPIEVAHVARELNRMIELRARQERELSESEARYGYLFDNMLEGFAYCRMVFENGKPRDFAYLKVNSAFEQLTGLKNVVGKNVTEVIPGIRESNPELFEIYGSVARTGEPASFETYVAALGFWFSVSAYRPEDGHFVAVFSNITERKRAGEGIRQLNVELEQRVAARTAELTAVNARLAESETQFRAVVESAPTAMVMIDTAGRIVLVNGQTEALFGYGRDELVGLAVETLLPQRFQGGHPAHREGFFARPQGRRMGVGRDLYALRKDGTEVPVEIGLNPVETSEGLFVLSAIVDITERKRAGDDIKHLNEALALHTASLEAANRELESFSYSVSHDLRGPLRSMDGFSLVLIEDYGNKLDAEGKDALERIRSASQRMGGLIDDLLRLSKVARTELKLKRVDLSGIARAVAESLQGDRSGRTVAWAIGEGMTITADSELVRILMQNLLQNAWKFTGKTEHAAIRVGTLERDGRQVCFVADNGVGFDMAHADQLFGAFQRLHHAADFPGTGIGLAIAQRIIHRHNGKIWAEAKEGKGATFFFTVGDLGNDSARQQDHPAG